MPKAGKVSLESLDIKDAIISKLKETVPGVFEEGKIDFDKLKSILAPAIDTREEKYTFSWAGRKDALLSLQSTSKGTLIPEPKESVNFDSTENIFIEGDNLEVLKLLQKSYFGKVKMIYIDPPYNTGKDFIYKDDFRSGIKSYLQQTGQANGDSVKLTTNPETNGRFHSDWLTMMYPRLFLARNLLKDDGVIFVSIDENEIHDLLLIMNDIFGEENLINICCRVMKTGGNQGKYFTKNIEFLLVYAKNIEKTNPFREKISKELADTVYNQIEPSGNRKGERYRIMGLFQPGLEERINQRFYIKCPDGTCVLPNGTTMPKTAKEGEKVTPVSGEGVWRWTYERFLEEQKKGNIIFKQTKNSPLVDSNRKKSDWNIYTKIWLSQREEDGKIPNDLFTKCENRHSSQELKELQIPFDFSKPSIFIKKMIEITSSNNEIILDFFAGSGTTAHATLDLNKEDNGNRKFILVQLPELTDKNSEAYTAGFKNIAEIAKERIRRVIKKLENESTQQKLGKQQKLDFGFKAFKLVKSNFKIWENFEGKDVSELKKQMSLFKNALVSGAKDIDVIFECAIKEGFNLNTKIEKVLCKGQTVYLASDDSSKFHICLDEKIKSNLADELKLTKESQLFCLDDALSDSQKMNLSLQCRLKTI